MPDLSVNGIDLHYETAGDGPPLLMIAGLSSDSASWAPIMPTLSQRAQLIMPDNRGCGRTLSNGCPITIDAIAEDYIALLDHLEIEKTDMLGHSMGGVIAMNIAAHHPGRVNRLVLAASGPEAPARTVSIIDTLLALREAGIPDGDWYRSFFHWLFKPSFFDDKRAVDAAIMMSRAYPHAQSTENMRHQVEALRNFDGNSLPKKITAPTLIIVGEEDLMFPAGIAEDNYRDLKNRQITTLPDAAHSLHWDAPHAFCGAILEFIGHYSD